MCEKAIEIQAMRLAPRDPLKPLPYARYELGDWLWIENWKSSKGQALVVIDEGRANGTAADDNAVWLPRQDQLQGMIQGNFLEVSDDFWYWSHDPDWRAWKDEMIPFTTGEQLWLAFVMYEKYNKAWNGSDWTLQSSSFKSPPNTTKLTHSL